MSRSETARIWQERLHRFASSQMTIAKFCQSEGVSQPSFYHWKKKLRQQPFGNPEPTGSPSRFVPIRIPNADGVHAERADEPASQTQASATIDLPGGIRIRVEVPDRLCTQQSEDQA